MAVVSDRLMEEPRARAGEADSGLRRGPSPLERLFSLCAPEDRKGYEPGRRSLRIDGHCTTIRLEQAFWSVLEEISAEEGMTIPEIIAQVQYHCQSVNDKNMASCLRVLCLKYINTCAWATPGEGTPGTPALPQPGPRMELDTRGLSCPQPILRTKKALRGLEPGEELRVITSDRGSAMDFDVFCQAMGHRLVWERETEEAYVFLLQKGTGGAV
ncbi:ribbon-helix-helix domain-containing protein [Alkalilimnicola ehrlichii MLHE-1]|uniref:SirA family protein n=1 Tax=Alkalilimnicola ehrlichii (strain ATCC BAA-1101 / DSM 17681 / MLHE-1) TaxID=187272 RepID=Q0A5P7_ALKEH|nr:ribbon-helix-helix domain-containing protein [Alkalilimnicola ehrlichii]ABI57840.1 SirA family protein [Alkalilimnicola ehrlichii MLHE-1]